MPAACDTAEIKDSITLGVPADGEVRGDIAGMVALRLEQFDGRIALLFVPKPAGVDNRHLEKQVTGRVGVRCATQHPSELCLSSV